MQYYNHGDKMEKNHKIIIIILIIAIIALLASLAYIFMGNNLTASDGNVPKGMQRYNFDSGFTMLVREDVKFLKSWEHNGLGTKKIYYDESKNYAVQYSQSDMFNNNISDELSKSLNSSGEYELSTEGNLKIFKVLNKSDKFDTGNGKLKHFKYRILIQEGNKYIIMSGNNLDSLKTMANSIKFEKGE